MDTAVGLVQAYLRVNGYFTVAEYPVLDATGPGGPRTITDLDILAVRLHRAPGASGTVDAPLDQPLGAGAEQTFSAGQGRPPAPPTRRCGPGRRKPRSPVRVCADGTPAGRRLLKQDGRWRRKGTRSHGRVRQPTSPPGAGAVAHRPFAQVLRYSRPPERTGHRRTQIRDEPRLLAHQKAHRAATRSAGHDR